MSGAEEQKRQLRIAAGQRKEQVEPTRFSLVQPMVDELSKVLRSRWFLMAVDSCEKAQEQV